MRRQIVLRPEAETEIIDAVAWYEDRGPGLAAEFLRAIDVAIASIQRNPLLFRTVHKDKRRALLRRFPYALTFVVTETEIVLLACMHSRRNPSRWKRRR